MHLANSCVHCRLAPHEHLALNNSQKHLQHECSAGEANSQLFQSDSAGDTAFPVSKRRRPNVTDPNKNSTAVVNGHIPFAVQEAWNTLLAHGIHPNLLGLDQSKILEANLPTARETYIEQCATSIVDVQVVAQPPSHAPVSYSPIVDSASISGYADTQPKMNKPNEENKAVQVDEERLLAVLDRLMKDYGFPPAKVKLVNWQDPMIR
jgi:hypothetical protein